MADSLCFTRNLIPQEFDLRDQSANGAGIEEVPFESVSTTRSLWLVGTKSTRTSDSDSRSASPAESSYNHPQPRADISSMSLAEFVQRRFIPEYVDIRRSAGRAHFRAILKHILHPEQVPPESWRNPGKANARLRAIEGWPYLDSLRLSEIDAEKIRLLTSAALKSGYSIQTATHIRNVIRVIFSYAIKSCCYKGQNPAAHVTLPAMTRREAHDLTLEQVGQVMRVMRYPERAIAFFALLTDMNVAEICGLQWQYVNLSTTARSVDEDWMPSKSIAIRNQWYRGEFQQVKESRIRMIPVPELLTFVLRDIRSREQFTRPQDFVVASRSGTPVYPENIAARRLKSIGKAIGMPWLSWSVFHRTGARLKSEFGRNLHKEYERVLPLQRT